jgi:hypothetical protein
MNPDKTGDIVIGTGASQLADVHVSSVELGCVNIKPSSCVRSLDITTDDTLSFDERIDSV